MSTIAYDLVQDPKVQAFVRRRFSESLRRLTDLGFGEVCIYRESGPRNSALRSFPVMAAMALRREVVSVRPGRRLSAAFPLLIRLSPPTYAYPFGLGVKYHTAFLDGSALVTANFESLLVPPAPGKLRKQSRRLPVEEAWEWHRKTVELMVHDGHDPDNHFAFEGFVRISRLEDEAAQTLSRPV